MKLHAKLKGKPFKIVAVSSNQNSFGLTGMVLVGRDGEGWEVGASHLHMKKVGDVVLVTGNRACRNFARLGYEIPRQLPKAPTGVVKQVWRG